MFTGEVGCSSRFRSEATAACIVAEHIRAINAFDAEAIAATFAKDAYVNDNHREIVGIDAIRRWVQKEIVGPICRRN
jgi:ketosteroid isomerase-like protein